MSVLGVSDSLKDRKEEEWLVSSHCASHLKCNSHPVLIVHFNHKGKSDVFHKTLSKLLMENHTSTHPALASGMMRKCPFSVLHCQQAHNPGLIPREPDLMVASGRFHAGICHRDEDTCGHYQEPSTPPGFTCLPRGFGAHCQS